MTKNELSMELQAMALLETALGGLDEDVRGRVLRWAAERFGLAGVLKPNSGKGGHLASKNLDERSSDDEEDDSQGEETHGDFETLSEFYDAASPSSDSEKALVASYWEQFHESSAEIDVQTVNTKLKHLGYALGNPTRAFEVLKTQKPALMVQLKKEGTSRQARKKFKVTVAGKKRVEAMVGKAPE
jgi:hypothetical protein